MFKENGISIICPFCRASLKRKDINVKNKYELDFEKEIRTRELMKMV